jgi:hypothetical protein
MPGDPKHRREHAKRCWALASEVTNPVLKESLTDAARRWDILAADLENVNSLLESLEDPEDNRLASAFSNSPKGLCPLGNRRKKVFVPRARSRKITVPPRSLAMHQTSFEDGPSEYICADKDADYLCRDVDNPTLGIFRVSACVAALIGATGATIQRLSHTTM